MAKAIYDWSTTANSNATADGTINAQTGALMSTGHPALRNMMARARAFITALAGIVSGGSSNAYTYANPTGHTWTALPSTAIIALKANFTNSGAATLNVDGIGAVAIKKGDGSVALAAGDMQNGGVYFLVYDGTVWQLLNPYTSAGSQPLATNLTALGALTFADNSIIDLTGVGGAAVISYATAFTNIVGPGGVVTGDFTISGNGNAMYWDNSGASTDNKLWRTIASSGAQLLFQALDHLNSATTWLTVDRSGGTPTKITAAVDFLLAGGRTNTTSAGFAGFGGGRAVTDNDTLVAGDNGKMVRATSGSSKAFTIPPVSSVAWPVGNTAIRLRNFTANTWSLARGSGVALRKSGSATDGNLTLAAWGSCVIEMEASDVWLANGDVS